MITTILKAIWDVILCYAIAIRREMLRRSIKFISRSEDKRQVVISCRANFYPVRMKKYLEENGYSVIILHNQSDDARREDLIGQSACFIVCIDQSYSKHLFNVNVALKRAIPIIPVIIDENSIEKIDNTQLKYILEQGPSSKRIIHMINFQQAMNRLLAHINDIFHSSNTALQEALRQYHLIKKNVSSEPVRQRVFSNKI